MKREKYYLNHPPFKELVRLPQSPFGHRQVFSTQHISQILLIHNGQRVYSIFITQQTQIFKVVFSVKKELRLRAKSLVFSPEVNTAFQYTNYKIFLLYKKSPRNVCMREFLQRFEKSASREWQKCSAKYEAQGNFLLQI